MPSTCGVAVPWDRGQAVSVLRLWRNIYLPLAWGMKDVEDKSDWSVRRSTRPTKADMAGIS